MTVRCLLLMLFGSLFLASTLVALAAPAKTVTLVKPGQPPAVLVIDTARYPLQQDLTNQWATVERTITNIAGVVSEYVGKSTGRKLATVDLATAPAPPGKVLIYIGRSAYVDSKVGTELDKLDPAGFLIRVVEGKHLIIAGPTSEGTEFGTYEFLERFVGVRWLMPTDIGDHVPRRQELTVPLSTHVKDEPAFMQIVAVASEPTHQTWARRQRFFTRLNFHHNLVNLFPPETYTKTHPQFFPLPSPDATARHLPRGHNEDFQPCFTAPGIVDEAAKNIIQAMDANPRIRSYSFGVNDTNLYCQCESCRREYLPGEVYLGMTQYSDAYFKFVNAVVEKVLQVHPDVWFGCLAYSHVIKPPVTVGVHPRVVPFLTMDTMQFLDPERRRAHEDLVAAWNAKCSFIGRYDYTYGDDHVPPRIYLHHWAKYVRWARAHKVKAWYAETYPFFGEAPKYYVMPRIWWNPDRDVDALLKEWYQCAFGKAAAPMKAYFDHWEDYWTRRVPQTEHFARCKNDQYLLGNPGWLQAATTVDIQKAEAWIAQAKKLADTPETKARVAAMARSWEYYRAIMETYIARGKSAERLSVEAALRLLDGQHSPLTQPLYQLREELMQDPLLVFTWKHSYPYGTAERSPFLDAAETFLDTGDARLAAKLGALAQGAKADLAGLSRTLLDIGQGRAQNLVPNPGFEEADPLQGWWAGMHQPPGQVQITQEKPYEGGHAVVVEGSPEAYGGVFRADVPIKPGKKYVFVLRARWDGQPATATIVQMLTLFQEADGRTLHDTLRGYSFRCTEEWRACALETRPAPATAAKLLVRMDALWQPQAGHRAFFDDLRVYEVGAPGP